MTQQKPTILQIPLTDRAALAALRAGDQVLLNGSIYTGRDAAHKRLIAALEAGQPLPINLQNQFLYYVGPAPAKPGYAVGPAGPTTSSRVDSYTPALLNLGLKGMVGKGLRSPAVVASMIKNGAVYFGAVGGAAALLATHITHSQVIAYPDLGPEAIHCFTLKDFPVTVLIDLHGGNLYTDQPALYAK